MTVYYCTKCLRTKDSAALQPSTDARDRWRLGLCECTKANAVSGQRKLVVFSVKPELTK